MLTVKVNGIGGMGNNGAHGSGYSKRRWGRKREAYGPTVQGGNTGNGRKRRFACNANQRAHNNGRRGQ